MAQHLLYHEKPRGSGMWAWIINIFAFLFGPFVIWFVGSALLARFEGETIGTLLTYVAIAAALVFYLWFCYALFIKNKKDGEKRGFWASKAQDRYIVNCRATKTVRVAKDAVIEATIPGIDEVEKEPVNMDFFTVDIKDEIPFDLGPPIVAKAQFILRIGRTDAQILRSRNLGKTRTALLENLQREGKKVLNIAVKMGASSYGRDKLLVAQPMISNLFELAMREFRTMQKHGLEVSTADLYELNDVTAVATAKATGYQAETIKKATESMSEALTEKGIDPALLRTMISMMDPEGELVERATYIQSAGGDRRTRNSDEKMYIAGLLAQHEHDGGGNQGQR